MSRSIIEGDKPGQCFVCYMYQAMGIEQHDPWLAEAIRGWNREDGRAIEEHHIFGGPLRQKSEHYGLKVHLCTYHHRTGPHAAHTDPEMANQLKMIAQTEYEKRYGHASFVQEFGKNYLPESRWTL